ncbi:TIGR01777 family oxidoreductase [Alteribacillus sp. JSM 102045]|uniref:TIGR01777 family oxidoreductase n=1 Tax=Alteribacillus sp. JSM 102045 TaxID=1562101 RepID=UPI0035C08A81
MNIAVTGGTGMVGSALTGYLTKNGHHVYILTRNNKNKQNKENITFIEWLQDGSTPENHLPPLDAIVNLAGASINSRWSKEQKNLILNSRVDATREVLRIIHASETKSSIFINASAVGYYGTSKDITFTESSNPEGRNFLQNVCEKWEHEASKAVSLGVRTVYARFGLILDDKEGALPKMMLPYSFFAGGPAGSGEQWYSWVHLKDVVEMLVFAIEKEIVNGPMNVTSPNPEKMKNFGKKLGGIISRPHWLPAPSFAIKTLLGDMSVLILEGQKVLPEKPLTWGYSFSYPRLEDALQDLLSS